MGYTVAVKVDNLALPKILVSTPSDPSGVVLIPNVEHYGTVKATVKDFIRRNLFIPDELQVLQAPLYRKLSEKEALEDLYKRYLCQQEVENPELHLDEDNFILFAREGSRCVDLDDNLRLEEYHILEKTVLQLRRLPQPLSQEGGRIFVETKDGILPLLGVTPLTRVLDLKQALERMTGIPVDQQLLTSVGRSMHDALCIKDFDGVHRVYADSTLDLYKSGDSNADQSHCRMVVSVNVMGEERFTMFVQGRDSVQSVQQVVEARTGVATWQQRVTYSGKVLLEKKTLSDYYIHSDSTLQVTIFRSPCKPPPKMTSSVQQSRENSGMEEHKPAARKIKLLRTSKGHIIGPVTIPVLTTDTVADLKRKVRRVLQPLTERKNLIVRSQAPGSGNNTSTNITPSKTATPSPVTKVDDQFSTSGRRLSRVLSFTGRTFSGHVGNGNSGTPGKVVAAVSTHQNSRYSDSETLSPSPPSTDRSNGKPVSRVLSSNKNFSGPLVCPSKHIDRLGAAPEPAAALLFPPPLSSPDGSPTQSSNPATNPETKMTPSNKVLPGEEVSPASVGIPLKFIPMRPNVGPFPKSSTSNTTTVPIAPSAKLHRGHARASSMGHISLNPAQFHSLPVHPIPPPDESVLPHTAQIPLGSNTTTSTSPKKVTSPKTTSPKKGNGATSEKRSLGAWFTDSMHTLKEYIK